MTTTNPITLPALGTLLPDQGGYYHGAFQLAGQLWGEVTAPKATGELVGVAWHAKYADVPGARSSFDGLANTQAMAEAGSKLAQQALATRINGLDGWYLAARGGLLLQRDNLQHLLPEDEAFEPRWYWSSTQSSRRNAFYQNFGYGSTDARFKYWEGGCARFVRRFLIQSLNP